MLNFGLLFYLLPSDELNFVMPCAPMSALLLQASQLGVTMPPLRMDSQVKYGLLSRGEASIFMRFPPPTYRCRLI